MIAWALRDYCRLAGTRTPDIEPGPPWQNLFVESFDTLPATTRQRRRVRYPARSQAIVEAWRIEHNTYRPHSSLGDLTSTDNAATWGPAPPKKHSHNGWTTSRGPATSRAVECSDTYRCPPRQSQLAALCAEHVDTDRSRARRFCEAGNAIRRRRITVATLLKEALVQRTRLSIGVRAAVGVGLVVCLAALSACGGKSTPSAAKSGFKIGEDATQALHFLPGKASYSNIDYAIWTPLTTVRSVDGKLKIVNGVAKSFSTKDEKVWTVTLNHGWTFHNGEPVTAKSFADSWNYTAYGPNVQTENYSFGVFEGYAAMNPTKGAPTAKSLSGIKVVDQYTLQITLNQPLALLPSLLSGTPFAPMPAAAFKNPAAFDKLPIGNGPYQVKSPGLSAGATSITLTKYAKYVGTPGTASNVTVNLYQNISTGYTDFLAGQVDVVSVSGKNLVTAAKKYPSQLIKVNLPSVLFLGFPIWDKLFANPLVRQAVSMAIDRKTIVSSLLGGFGTPADGLVPPNLPGAGNVTCSACTYNPAKARELLAQAGGWKGGSLGLWTSSYEGPTGQVVLAAIANQLKQNLGIPGITQHVQPVDQIFGNLAAHKIDGLYLIQEGAGYPDAYALANQILPPGSGWNLNGYSNPGVNALLVKAAQATSPAQVETNVQRAIGAAFVDLPITPILWPQTGILHAKGLNGVSPSLFGDVDVASVK